MQKYIGATILLLGMMILVSGCLFSAAKEVKSQSKPITHQIWDDLLQKHVVDNGNVDYKGFIKDSLELNKYTDLLQKGHPNKKNWSENEQIAYWINAYNAFTIQLIIRNYPVQSIKDIGGNIPFVNSPWDIDFINIEGTKYDINNIEHNILRPKYEEPRIHFAINCASISCPRLLNKAYTAENLNEQLDMVAAEFINNPTKNKITYNKIELSKIFTWFKGDFTKKGTLIEYLNQYSETKINKDATIEYLEYNWGLNEE